MPPLGRPHLQRSGSYGSSTNSSGASTSSASLHARAPSATKAELVASLVEVAKEEPKVWNSVVDHLTHQHHHHATAGEEGSALVHHNHHHHHHAQYPEAVGSEYQTGFADPVALENIAYAVESKTDDEALDELIHMLNNDATEEYIQDVLDQAALSHEAPVPPSVTVNISATSSEEEAERREAYGHPHDVVASTEPGYRGGTVEHSHSITTNTTNSSSGDEDQHKPLQKCNSRSHYSSHGLRLLQHKRVFTADDDMMWSVLKEPLPLHDVGETGEPDGYDWR